MYKLKQLIIESFRNGSFDKGVNARSIWISSEYYNAISIESFQRTVAKVTKEFQEENLIKARNGEPFEVFLSCPTGYFIATGIKDEAGEFDFVKGYDFYIDRIKKYYKREKVLRLLIMKKFRFDPKERKEVASQIEIPFELLEEADNQIDN